MGSSITGDTVEGELLKDGQPTGLIVNHAYSILDTIDIGDHRLLKIWNPWGSENPVEWNGEFSDGTQELKENLDKINDIIKTKWKKEAEPI